MTTHRRSHARRIRHEDTCELDHHLDDRCSDLVPVDTFLRSSGARLVLAAVIAAHRDQLVAAARGALGSLGDAEDRVQDLCLAALTGEIDLPSDPSEALDVLLRMAGDRFD